MIDNDLGLLRIYAALGVRYLTLTHSINTPWADSSGDKPAHDGLTPFGKDVVRELNRLGMMVDISHVADKTFFDTLEVTKAPVIASHSSARAIANAPRNMTDDMLRAVTKNGGVVMVNYHSGFLSEEFRTAHEEPRAHRPGRRGEQEMRHRRSVLDSRRRTRQPGSDAEGRAAEGDVGEDRRAHRPRREDRRHRSRRPRFGLRRGDDADRDGGRRRSCRRLPTRCSRRAIRSRTCRRFSGGTFSE